MNTQNRDQPGMEMDQNYYEATKPQNAAARNLPTLKPQLLKTMNTQNRELPGMELEEQAYETFQATSEVRNKEKIENMMIETQKSVESIRKLMWLSPMFLLMIFSAGFAALYFSISAKVGMETSALQSKLLKQTNSSIEANRYLGKSLTMLRDQLERNLSSLSSSLKSIQDQYSYQVGTHFSCDFERGLCNFADDLSAKFTWTRHSGSTGSSDTGPSVDHTLGTTEGHYMYIETSPRQLHDKARLVSLMLPPTNGQCLQFYYHMYGTDIGTLESYLKKPTLPNEVIWSLSGNQSDVWSLGNATITSTEPFQVVFEGTRGSDFHGDIAIDDVTIKPSNC